MKMKVKVEIDTKTFVRFWLVIVGFSLAALLAYNARTALILVGISFFLAIALSKPVAWFAKKLPGNSRLGATALSFLMIVAALVTLAVLVVPPVVSQSARLAENLPSMFENARNQWSGLAGLIDQYDLQPQIDQAAESIKSNLSSLAADVGTGFISGIGSVLMFFVNTFLVLTLTFFMLLEANRWVSGFWGLYKAEEKMKRHKHIATRMYNVTTSYVNGQVAIAAIGAMFAGIAAAILGTIFGTPVDLAFPIIAITFIFTMIPMFGSTIAGTLGALLLALNNIPAGIIFAIYFVVYQQIENNFIAPTVQSRTMNLSPLAVLLAAAIGTYMVGIVGGIVAIPIAGCIAIFIDEYKNGTLTATKNDDIRSPRTGLLSKLLGKKDLSKAESESK